MKKMNDDPWDTKYLYYANPAETHNSINKIDTKTMTLKADIHVVGINPHSVDRACFTDKMYCRTQSTKAFSVIDARTEKYIKEVQLPFTPRTCGDQNYKHNLQLISGRSDPGIAVVNVDNDEVIFVNWEPAAGRKPKGNQGGNASGHGVWFDNDHFGYLDRLSNEIRIFKIYIDDITREFSFVRWQIVTESDGLKTAMHTIQDDKIDVTLTTATLFGTVEGFKPSSDNPGTAIIPGIQEFKWNSAQGAGLSVERFIELPYSSTDDTIHHYSILPNTRYLFIPTYLSRKTHIVNTDTMSISHTYDSGYGGGHVNFAISRALAIITNHFDDHVTIINYTTNEVKKVKINNEEPGYPGKHLLQTHANWVSEDDKFFYIGNSHSGDYVEINLEHFTVSRKLFVGGHPEQSIS